MQGKTSHKFVDLSENAIMRVYYTNRTVLFFMCAGNEAFYAALYLLHFTEGYMGKKKKKSLLLFYNLKISKKLNNCVYQKFTVYSFHF